MDPYYQEDLTALQEWWQRNGKSLIFGLLIGVGGVIGWRFWEAAQLREAEEASGIFQELLTVAESVETGPLGEEDAQTMERLVERLHKDYPDTAYAALAALLQARFLAEEEDLAAAAARLRWALENGKEPMILHIARLRLVRVLLADRKLEEAEQELQAVNAPYLSPTHHELQGDLWWLKERRDIAADFYRKALQAAKGNPPPFLQMKLEELGDSAAAGEKG